MLKMIYEFFQMDPSSGVLHSLEDLLAVKLHGNRLDLFLRSWDAVLIGITKPVDPDLKLALFVQQIANCNKLLAEYREYSLAEAGTYKKSYDYLYNAARMTVERERHLHNRERVKTHLFDAMPAGRAEEDDNPAPKGNKDKDSGFIDKEECGRDGKRICFNFARGTCKRGSDCSFSHEFDISKYNKGKEGSHKDRVTRDNPVYRTVVCQWWARDGKCKHGDQCTFSHDRRFKGGRNSSNNNRDKDGRNRSRDKGGRNRSSDKHDRKRSRDKDDRHRRKYSRDRSNSRDKHKGRHRDKHDRPRNKNSGYSKDCVIEHQDGTFSYPGRSGKDPKEASSAVAVETSPDSESETSSSPSSDSKGSNSSRNR